MDSYQVIEKIGQGGMGVVFRAVQSSLGREVALKLLLGGPESTSPRELQRFAREVRSIARITHPNVVRVLDFGQMDGRPFYAMEYLGKAQPLHRLIKDKPLPLNRVYAIARQLLDALSAVHLLGLVHRDLKPGNVMMDGRNHVTLMDFGLVKDLDATSLTTTRTRRFNIRRTIRTASAASASARWWS